MSELSKFDWDARDPENEEDNYLASIVDELNEINEATGRPKIRLVSAEEPVANTISDEQAADLDRAREIELATAGEIELEEARDKELEQARGFDVRKIMAEDAAAKEQATAEEQTRAKKQETTKFKIKEATDINDPDMHEIVLEEEPAKELNIIGGEIRSRGLQERAEQNSREEQLESIIEELADIDQEIAELDEIIEAEKPKPLVAVGVDWSRSEEELAKQAAKADLERELKGSGIIKKIWKGKLFRDFYEEKYIDEYLSGDRTDRNGKTIAEAIEEQKQGLVTDFVNESIDEMRQIDRKNWNQNGYRGKNGERLIPVEKETNDKIRSTIEDYARFMVEFAEIRPEEARDPEFIKDVDRKFNSYMDRLIDKAIEDGKITSDIRGNNYLEVAKEAAKRYQEVAKNATNKVEQDAAMAQVMAGFQAYNIETTKAFTAKHQSYVDKIIDKLGSDKVGQYVPAEALSRAVEKMNLDPENSYEDWNDEILEEINEKADSIGGPEGISIITDTTPYGKKSTERYQAWWNNLSDEGKQTVRELADKINSSKYNTMTDWGNGFRLWLFIFDK